MKITVDIDVEVQHILIFRNGNVTEHASFSEDKLELEEIIEAMREKGVPVVFSQFDRDELRRNMKSCIAICKPENVLCLAIEDENVKILNVKKTWKKVTEKDGYGFVGTNFYNIITMNIYGKETTFRELRRWTCKRT